METRNWQWCVVWPVHWCSSSCPLCPWIFLFSVLLAAVLSLSLPVRDTRAGAEWTTSSAHGTGREPEKVPQGNLLSGWDLEVSVISQSEWSRGVCSALGEEPEGCREAALFSLESRVVSWMGFELLRCGETFCIPGHRITSHLCQNPDDDDTGSNEKYLLYNSYPATLFQFLLLFSSSSSSF